MIAEAESKIKSKSISSSVKYVIGLSYLNIFIIFALCVANFNANEISKPYLKYSPSGVALSYAGNSVIRIGDTPSLLGLAFLK